MAQDAHENIPAKLRAEEAAAEAEFLKGVGEEPAPDGTTADADPMPPATEAEPPPTDGNEPPAPTADATPATEDGDTPKTTPDSDEQKPTGTLEQQLAEALARAERAENQYKTLMGKYNAEPPRLQREIVDLKKVVSDLETQLKAAQAGKAPTDGNADTDNGKADPAPKALDPANPYGLTDDQLEFGDDIIGVAEKIAKKLVEDQIGDVRTKADGAAAELQRRAQGEFVAQLDGLAPEWRAIDVDPAFEAFCDEVEPNSGLTWQEIIDRGKGSMDAARIAGVFNTFRSRQGETKPAKTTSPAATTTVEAQVEPSSAPSPSPNAKRVYSLAEYERLMKHVATGKYGIGSKRAQDIEAELDKALIEGRVKG